MSFIHVSQNSPAKLQKQLCYSTEMFNIQCICCHGQKNSDILCSPEGQDVVRMYNQTAAALVEFECVYHKAWMEEVSKLDFGWFSDSG